VASVVDHPSDYQDAPIETPVPASMVIRRAERALDIPDNDGYRTSESAPICRPRSLLEIGSLDEFVRDDDSHLLSTTSITIPEVSTRWSSCSCITPGHDDTSVSPRPRT
jgi:hypothetical protein